jgi:hypothetical protein
MSIYIMIVPDTSFFVRNMACSSRPSDGGVGLRKSKHVLCYYQWPFQEFLFVVKVAIIHDVKKVAIIPRKI